MCVVNFLQYFVDQKHLVAFSVIVQAYWRLKVDGSNIILGGDIAPPDVCLKIGKRGKKKSSSTYTSTISID